MNDMDATQRQLIGLSNAEKKLRHASTRLREALARVLCEKLGHEDAEDLATGLISLEEGSFLLGQLSALITMPEATVRAIPVDTTRALVRRVRAGWPPTVMDRSGLAWMQVEKTPQDFLRELDQALGAITPTDPAALPSLAFLRYREKASTIVADLEEVLALEARRLSQIYQPGRFQMEQFFLQLIALSRTAGYMSAPSLAEGAPPLDRRWLRSAHIRARDVEAERVRLRRKKGIELAKVGERVA